MVCYQDAIGSIIIMHNLGDSGRVVARDCRISYWDKGRLDAYNIDKPVCELTINELNDCLEHLDKLRKS